VAFLVVITHNWLIRHTLSIFSNEIQNQNYIILAQCGVTLMKIIKYIYILCKKNLKVHNWYTFNYKTAKHGMLIYIYIYIYKILFVTHIEQMDIFEPHVFNQTYLASCSCLKNKKYTTLSGRKHHWRKNVLNGYHIRSPRGSVHQPNVVYPDPLSPAPSSSSAMKTHDLALQHSCYQLKRLKKNRRGPWCL